MGTDDLEEGFAKLAAILSKQGNRGFRRYDLKRVDGRMMLIRDEIDRAFDLAMSEVCGIELEPDEKLGRDRDPDAVCRRGRDRPGVDAEAEGTLGDVAIVGGDHPPTYGVTALRAGTLRPGACLDAIRS